MLRFTAQGGGELPALGYGTAHIKDPETILAALETGYRHVDTAVLYGNHRAVGEALRRSNLSRHEVFLTTKVSFWSKGGELDALQRSLEELGVDQVDMCLLHTPFTGSWTELLEAYLPHRIGRFQPLAWAPLRALADPARWVLRAFTAVFGPQASTGAALRRTAWRELEAARRSGQCRYIGVSNFNAGLLMELMATARDVPAANQIEFHPRYQAHDTISFCRSHGIAVVGYGNGLSVDSEAAASVAHAHSEAISPAQAALAWTLAAGVGAVVRSSRRVGMAQNLAAATISLTVPERSTLGAADEGLPFYWDVGAVARMESEADQRSDTGGASRNEL